MAQPHAVEVLLRPAVELYTVAVCTGAAILCLVAPWSLALNPLLGLGSALAFLTFGAIRLRDAWAILRYRRNIRRLPRYVMTSRDVPVSQQRLFVGQGFRWEQRHTHRLMQTYRPEFRRYVEPTAIYRAARRLEERRVRAVSRLDAGARVGLGQPAQPGATTAVGRRTATPAWHRTCRGRRHPAAGRARRPHPGAGHHARGQDAAGRAVHHPGHPPQGPRRARGGDRLRPQGRCGPVEAHVRRGQARRARRRVLRLPSGLAGHLGALQRRGPVRADLRGGHADRRAALRRRQQRRVPRIRLALRQHHRARPGRAGAAAGLPADPAPRHQHRRAVHRVRPALLRQERAEGLGGHRPARSEAEREEHPAQHDRAREARGGPRTVPVPSAHL